MEKHGYFKSTFSNEYETIKQQCLILRNLGLKNVSNADGKQSSARMRIIQQLGELHRSEKQVLEHILSEAYDRSSQEKLGGTA
ncbi:hypothetical protein D3C87_2033130 [compost metagenome]